MRLVELPGQAIINIEAIAVAAFQRGSIDARGAHVAKLELAMTTGGRFTLEGDKAVALWAELKKRAEIALLPRDLP